MSKTTPAWGCAVAGLLGVLAGLPLAAAAQVYKCPQANGSFSYQGTPCPTSGKAPARPGAAELNAQRPAADEKPFYDPYAGSASSRPHPVAPVAPLAQPPRETSETPPARPSLAQQQARYDNERIRDEHERIRKENERIAASNQAIRCERARQQLGVLTDQTSVYRRDSNGNRVYISDANRPAEVTAAQQGVVAACG